MNTSRLLVLALAVLICGTNVHAQDCDIAKFKDASITQLSQFDKFVLSTSLDQGHYAQMSQKDKLNVEVPGFVSLGNDYQNYRKQSDYAKASLEEQRIRIDTSRYEGALLTAFDLDAYNNCLAANAGGGGIHFRYSNATDAAVSFKVTWQPPPGGRATTIEIAISGGQIDGKPEGQWRFEINGSRDFTVVRNKKDDLRINLNTVPGSTSTSFFLAWPMQLVHRSKEEYLGPREEQRAKNGQGFENTQHYTIPKTDDGWVPDLTAVRTLVSAGNYTPRKNGYVCETSNLTALSVDLRTRLIPAVQDVVATITCYVIVPMHRWAIEPM